MTTLLMALYAVVMVSGIYGLILQHKLPTLMKERLPAEIVYEQIPNIRAQLCAAAERLHESYTGEPTSRTTNDTQRRAAPSALAAAALPDVSEHAVVKTPSAAEKPMGGSDGARDVDHAGGDCRIRSATKRRRRSRSRAASETVLADFIERQLLPYLRSAPRRQIPPRHTFGRRRKSFRHLRLRVAARLRPRVDEMQGWCDERRLLDAQSRHAALAAWLAARSRAGFILAPAADGLARVRDAVPILMTRGFHAQSG